MLMKAAVMTGYGQPLEIREVERPRPLLPEDVIVRIAGAGVCRTDLHLWDGSWTDVDGKAVRLPHILGHENVGWIEESGEEARRLGLVQDDPVILHPLNSCGLCGACRRGDDMLCDTGREPGIHSIDGGFAEFMRTKLRCVVKLPATVELVSLAPFADAGLTAYHAVKRVLPHLRARVSVVVVGIGGLGQFAIQLLKVLSTATVIAVDVTEERLAIGRSLGADEVVLAPGGVFAEAVRSKADGGGAAVVMDFVGAGSSTAEGLSATGRGGVYSVIGYGGSLETPTRALVQKELTVLGNLAGSYADLRELMSLHQAGLIESRYRQFPLSAAAEVLERLRQSSLPERAVLVPS